MLSNPFCFIWYAENENVVSYIMLSVIFPFLPICKLSQQIVHDVDYEDSPAATICKSNKNNQIVKYAYGYFFNLTIGIPFAFFTP